MAFVDWQQITSLTTVTLETISPILNTSSLKLTSTAVNARAILLPSLTASPLRPHALVKGAIRTLIKPVAFTGSNSIGLTCLQSARDVRTSGTAYNASLRNGSIVLTKGNIHTNTILASSAFTLTAGVVTALELQWIVAIDEINGVDLVVKTGTMTDFSDLAEVIHYVDISSPLSITYGESLNIDDLTSGSSFTVLFDQTQLFRIT